VDGDHRLVPAIVVPANEPAARKLEGTFLSRTISWLLNKGKMAYTPSLLRHKAFGMSESDRSVPTSLVNLDLYPIADTTSGSGKAFADRCQREYAESGLCILPEFISEKPLKRLAQEANKLQRHCSL